MMRAVAVTVALTLVASAAAACPTDRDHCFELTIHVAQEGGAPVVDAAWLKVQVDHANRLFAPMDAGFFAGPTRPMDTGASIDTRAQRDALGAMWERGTIHVFVAAHVANVDDPGEINGVHWRDRANRSRRWIILSAIAWELTLAHELGHYFGLPHSAYDISVMNKTPRAEPKPADRVFHAREIRRMKARKTQMLRARELTSVMPDIP